MYVLTHVKSESLAEMTCDDVWAAYEYGPFTELFLTYFSLKQCWHYVALKKYYISALMSLNKALALMSPSVAVVLKWQNTHPWV